MTRNRLTFALIAVLCSFGMSAPTPIHAEEVKNAFKGLSKNSGEPIDIFADTLTIYDEKKLAVFKGNVRAKQGSSTLRAGQLDVHYIGGAENFTGPQPATANASEQQSAEAAQGRPEEEPESQIEKIEAEGKVVIVDEDNNTTTSDWLRYDVGNQKVTIRGNVVINSDKDQTTTSDWATYDVAAEKAVVGGNVILSQGNNVLKGDRLNIDLATGESRFENTGSTAEGGDGRIRALLLPKGAEDDGKRGKEKKKKKQNEIEVPF